MKIGVVFRRDQGADWDVANGNGFYTKNCRKAYIIAVTVASGLIPPDHGIRSDVAAAKDIVSQFEV
jgi:hypothetical protein